MFRRLFALLLLLALAAPAMAMNGHCSAPAETAVRMAEHSHEHKPPPAEKERRDCIGCVLPGLGAVTALRRVPASTIVGAVARPDEGTSALHRPDIPPPRA